MKAKTLMIFLLLILFSTATVASPIATVTAESTSTELLQETAEAESSEPIDELKLFYNHLFSKNSFYKSLSCFSQTLNLAKTRLQDIFRPPIFS